MSKRLLLIDDDLVPGLPHPTGNYMWLYTQALRDHGYDLVEITGVDAALELLAADTQSFHLVLLDIMMPHGKAFTKKESDSGLCTGALLAERLRQSHPNLPIVILTNVENPETRNRVKGKPNVRRILTKTDYPPFAVVEEIKEVLGE